uniref:MHC class I-like antigen recognition-like domain-containing protein n=4 Tax=Anatinae TaxID=2068716 RepID=A0A8B9UYI3_9AVES
GPPGPPLLLLAAPVPAEPHSLRYFYTAVSDPSPGVPQFMSVGYVDGHLIDRYDSETRRDEPGAGWIAANMDQQYWDRQTETLQGIEQVFRMGLDALRERYNQSRGENGWAPRCSGCLVPHPERCFQTQPSPLPPQCCSETPVPE